MEDEMKEAIKEVLKICENCKENGGGLDDDCPAFLLFLS